MSTRDRPLRALSASAATPTRAEIDEALRAGERHGVERASVSASVQAAYQTLTDPYRRAEHDRALAGRLRRCLRASRSRSRSRRRNRSRTGARATRSTA